MPTTPIAGAAAGLRAPSQGSSTQDILAAIAAFIQGAREEERFQEELRLRELTAKAQVTMAEAQATMADATLQRLEAEQASDEAFIAATGSTPEVYQATTGRISAEAQQARARLEEEEATRTVQATRENAASARMILVRAGHNADVVDALSDGRAIDMAEHLQALELADRQSMSSRYIGGAQVVTRLADSAETQLQMAREARQQELDRYEKWREENPLRENPLAAMTPEQAAEFRLTNNIPPDIEGDEIIRFLQGPEGGLFWREAYRQSEPGLYEALVNSDEQYQSALENFDSINQQLQQSLTDMLPGAGFLGGTRQDVTPEGKVSVLGPDDSFDDLTVAAQDRTARNIAQLVRTNGDTAEAMLPQWRRQGIPVEEIFERNLGIPVESWVASRREAAQMLQQVSPSIKGESADFTIGDERAEAVEQLRYLLQGGGTFEEFRDAALVLMQEGLVGREEVLDLAVNRQQRRLLNQRLPTRLENPWPGQPATSRSGRRGPR